LKKAIFITKDITYIITYKKGI